MPDKAKTKLLSAVCKRAALMRASYRVSSYSTVQLNQKNTNKNLSSNNKTKQQLPLIIKTNKKKIDEKVRTHQYNKHRSLINLIGIQ